MIFTIVSLISLIIEKAYLIHLAISYKEGLESMTSYSRTNFIYRLVAVARTHLKFKVLKAHFCCWESMTLCWSYEAGIDLCSRVARGINIGPPYSAS